MNRFAFIFLAALCCASCASSPKFTARGSYQLPVQYDEAESYRTGKPDRFVHAIIESPEFSAYRGRDPFEYIQLVAFHIKSNSKNDFERVKRAHDFVTIYLQYDIKSYKASTRMFFPKASKRQDAAGVVRSGFAVCGGYANLFKALCDAMNIPCEYVAGYARAEFFDPFKKKELAEKRAAHAWNLVQVDDRWYIVDTTWDSGYITNGKKPVFEKSYSTEYLFTRPQYFAYTHLPYNLNQELLEYLIPPDDFVQLPYQRPTYFEKVLQISPRLIKEYEVSGEVLALSYVLQDGFELDFKLYDKTGKTDLSRDQKYFEKKQSKRNSTQFYFNKKGMYTLRIYSRESSYAGNEYIAECGLIVR